MGQLTEVGGWQLYINNKIRYMRQEKWVAIALASLSYSSSVDDIKLDYLKKYGFYDFKEFMLLPSYFDEKNLMIIIKKINDILFELSPEGFDEIVVESTSINYAPWGEYIASQLNGRHLFFSVHSHYGRISDSELAFFEYKYRRNELYGILENSLKEMFKDYLNIPESDKHVLVAPCRTAMIDDGVDYSVKLNFSDYHYIIGSLAQLQKGYILPMVKQIVNFAKNYDKRILLIFIGSSNGEIIERRILETINDCQNVHPKFCGSLSEIPKNLVVKFDLCVASFGSATVSSLCGAKTLCMTDDCDQPLGMIGYDLIEKPYHAKYKPNSSIFEYLTEFLVNKTYENKVFTPTIDIYDENKYFERHLVALKMMDSSKCYYDITKTKGSLLRYFIHKSLIYLIGFENVYKIKYLIRKIIK